MQKNMLVAIVLSVLIMIVWMRFFAPKPPEQTVKQEQAAEQAYEQTGEQVAKQPEKAAPETKVEPEPVEESVPPEELAKARDVVVETPHMVATFTTLGGKLTSLRLPEYQSKLGGDVELVPQGEGMQWPLALQFNDPEFGTRTENFLYESTLYLPSDDALRKLADELRQCSGRVYSQADEAEVRRQLGLCLPQSAGNEDLRTLVLTIAGETVSSGGGTADALLTKQAERLSNSKVLIFSHQMTPSLRLIKAFVFDHKNYSFDMHTIFRNTSAEPLNLGRGEASYSINWVPGMESSESSPRQDQLYAVYLEGKNFQQEKVMRREGIFATILVKLGLKSRKKEEEWKTSFSKELVWVGLKRKYFFITLEPGGELMGASVEPLSEKEERARITLDMLPMKIKPGHTAAGHIRLFAGPMLKSVLESCGPGFGQILNFGFFDLFAKILMEGLLWFNKAVQNYGLAIILLTIVVRVGLFPLNQKSYKSMREMQTLQPLVTELREKYKKNPQEMNKKMMQLYRDHKVNPMGGCLPMAFQMPIFFALFQALRNAIELRGAHFLWIKDLSEPDQLFTLTVPFHLPVNLLPLLVIVAMLIQQKMTPMTAGGQSEGQQKMMQYMPVIFGFLFYSMPSGLTVYFLVSTVLGLVQQYFVQKAV